MKTLYKNLLNSMLSIMIVLNGGLIAKEIPGSDEIVHARNFEYVPSVSPSSRSVMDTLAYDYDWYSYFNMIPGDMMITVYEVETDGVLRGVNVPIAHWGGNTDDDLTISIHKTSYPYDTNGNMYDQNEVDGAGWLAGYDDDGDGLMEIEGSTWNSANGNCSGVTMINNAQDPLGTDAAASGPAGTPNMGLIWPDGSTAATLNPTDNPSIENGGGDNWIQLSDYGTEPTLNAGDYICVAVHYTGTAGDGSDPWVGFLYSEHLDSPWTSLKFYSTECGGTSSENGWHIRHYAFNFQLEIEYTADRGPQISIISDISSATTESVLIEANITDDNPDGGASGVNDATVYYTTDEWNTEATVAMSLESGDANDGVWAAHIPSQNDNTFVSYYITATDVNGNQSTSITYDYQVYQVTSYTLFINNSINYWDESIMDQYLATLDVDMEYMDTKITGIPNAEFLNLFPFIIEVSGEYPQYNLMNTIREWYEVGSKRLIVCGQDFLWMNEGWSGDHTYYEGSFEHDVLGLTGSRMELYWDTYAYSRLYALEDNFISGSIYDLVNDDNYYFNYAPQYEQNHNNYIDGLSLQESVESIVEVVEGSFYGLEDPDPSSTIFSAGLYNESYGSRVIFFAFNPLATNAYNSNNNPEYVQIGQSEYGLLQHAIGFMLPETEVEFDEVIAFLGDTVSVGMNVSFFTNNTSYFAFEGTFSGYQDGLEFIGFDTVSTLMGSAGWYYSYNTNDDSTEVYFAATGDTDVEDEGTLMRLQFIATEALFNIPIHLENAVFNADMAPQVTTGYVDIYPNNFGDVDFNGVIQAYDAALVLQSLVDYITLDWMQERMADVTQDTSISALDAAVILQYVVSLIDTLPYDGSMGSMIAGGETFMDNIDVQANQTFMLPINMNQAENILSFEGVLEYDPATIQINDLIWNQSFGNFFIEEDFSDGTIRFVGAGVSRVDGVSELVQMDVLALDGLTESTQITLTDFRLNENTIIDVASAAEISLSVLGIDDQMPSKFALNNNYPNPFNPETTIHFDIPEEAKVKLTIYDVSGKEVNVLTAGTLNAGSYRVRWDGKDHRGQGVSAGMYLYHIDAGEFSDTKKLILLK